MDRPDREIRRRAGCAETASGDRTADRVGVGRLKPRAPLATIIAAVVALPLRTGTAALPVAPVPTVTAVSQDSPGSPPIGQPAITPMVQPNDARAALVGPGNRCASARDQSLSEVLSLRTRMIVLAVKCGRAEDYNVNFVAWFKPMLQAHEAEMKSWFEQIYGASGASHKDAFATDLVNAMSREAFDQGLAYCVDQARQLIDGLKSLGTMDDLTNYAAVRDETPENMNIRAWSVGHP